MSALGVRYRTLETDIDEISTGLPPAELARRLALKKASRAEKMLKTGRGKGRPYLIVGADTIVALGRSIYGKPRSRSEARSQLSRLSGKAHAVITGLAILDSRLGVSAVASECSLVRMRKLTGSEIEAYLDSGEPMGKAGSYAIQGKGGALVAALRGDYFNVVGFPIRLFALLAAAFGLPVPESRIKSLYRRPRP
jgi:septum formation protein